MSKFYVPMLNGDGSIWRMEVSRETAARLRANGYEVNRGR